jgi:hypothetical protein
MNLNLELRNIKLKYTTNDEAGDGGGWSLPTLEDPYPGADVANPPCWLRDFSHLRNFLPNFTSDYIPDEGVVASSSGQSFFLSPPVHMSNPGKSIGVDMNSSVVEVWLAGLMARVPVALIAFLDSSGIL